MVSQAPEKCGGQPDPRAACSWEVTAAVGQSWAIHGALGVRNDMDGAGPPKTLQNSFPACRYLETLDRHESLVTLSRHSIEGNG